MDFCVDMRLSKIPSDEQPTQELNLKEQTTLSMTVGQPQFEQPPAHSNAAMQRKKSNIYFFEESSNSAYLKEWYYGGFLWLCSLFCW